MARIGGALGIASMYRPTRSWYTSFPSNLVHALFCFSRCVQLCDAQAALGCQPMCSKTEAAGTSTAPAEFRPALTGNNAFGLLSDHGEQCVRKRPKPASVETLPRAPSATLMVSKRYSDSSNVDKVKMTLFEARHGTNAMPGVELRTKLRRWLQLEGAMPRKCPPHTFRDTWMSRATHLNPVPLSHLSYTLPFVSIVRSILSTQLRTDHTQAITAGTNIHSTLKRKLALGCGAFQGFVMSSQ